jgi:hypothetical protein
VPDFIDMLRAGLDRSYEAALVRASGDSTELPPAARA